MKDEEVKTLIRSRTIQAKERFPRKEMNNHAEL